MQKLGSLRNLVQDKINNVSNTISTKIKNMHNDENRYNPYYDDKLGADSKNETNLNSNDQSVEWHNFTLKELLEISKQNKWNDVNKDITSLIVSLSNHNPTKRKQSQLIDTNQSSKKTDGKQDSKEDEEKEEKEEGEEKMSGSDALKIISYLRTEFECDICLDCYIEPLTLSCGHSFCRLCIIQIQSKCDKKCPLCKTVTNGIDPHLHSQNIVINNCVKQLFSRQRYNERVEQLNREKSNLKKNIPVFILNMVRFPGQLLQLHLFEPRYLHMINRAISSGNSFAYLCKTVNNQNGNGYRPYDHDIACLIKIKECQFLPDGRCLMQGLVEKRIKVTNNWIEKGTQGLWYIKYTEYTDNYTDNNNHNIFIDEKQLELINKFINHIYNGPNQIIKAIENECGSRVLLNDKQTNIEQFSFWVCSLIYVLIGKDGVDISWIKKTFHTQNPSERVQFVCDVLKLQTNEWNK